MDALLEFVLNLLGEAAIGALAPVTLAVIWALGAFCLVYRWTNGLAAGVAGLVAFVFGLWLTYLWDRKVRWARNTLLIGALIASLVATWVIWKASTA
jgi:hypothetical protein